jgi:hypothetical protein
VAQFNIYNLNRRIKNAELEADLKIVKKNEAKNSLQIWHLFSVSVFSFYIKKIEITSPNPRICVVLGVAAISVPDVILKVNTA